jgi:hypothetical protein
MQKSQLHIITGTLLMPSAVPVFGQRDRGDLYYRGMNDHVRRGDYERYSRDDERRDHHGDGGFGPGKGVLIGGTADADRWSTQRKEGTEMKRISFLAALTIAGAVVCPAQQSSTPASTTASNPAPHNRTTEQAGTSSVMEAWA